MAIKPVLDLLESPLPNDESCHMMGSSDMLPLKVRQKDLVPLRYLRILLACAQWDIVGSEGHMPTQMVNNSCDVRAGTVGAIEKLSDKRRERECMLVQRVF